VDPILSYGLNMLVYIGIFAIIALSLNLEYGYTGLGNFGKVGFVLVGAYSYALLAEVGIHFIPALIISAIICAIFGLLVSLPAIRLREDYLAITTLTFGEILRIIVKSEDWIANGVWGIQVPPAIPIEGAQYSTGLLVNIGLVFACLAICFIFVQILTNSPYGRILRAIREDDTAADSLGKNKFKYKAQVFMMGSALAGIGGALLAQYLGFISPNMFLPLVTFTIWIMVILGGPANNWGVLLGAALVQLFERGTTIIKDYITLPIDPTNVQYILFGVLIILIMMFRSGGLLRESKVKTLGAKRAKEWMNRSLK
jgi:branched-chain amino acid transport system permease protein